MGKKQNGKTASKRDLADQFFPFRLFAFSPFRLILRLAQLEDC